MQEMNMIPTSVYILQGFNVNILDSTEKYYK